MNKHKVRGTALGILALWVGRKHLKQVIAQVVTGKAGIDDSRESMSYRAAILGIIGGVLFFLWFAYSAGFSFWVILLFLGLYCCGAIGLTKVRASLGVAVHELLWVDPGRTMVTSIGTRAYGPPKLDHPKLFLLAESRSAGTPDAKSTRSFSDW